MPDLLAYIRAAAAQRYALGSADCMTLVADWIAFRRGADPMMALRGYADAASAGELISGWGGIARVMGRAMRAAGLPLTRSPQPGDVALVALPSGTAAGAIRSTRGWAMRLDTGMATLPPDAVRVVAAWSV